MVRGQRSGLRAYSRIALKIGQHTTIIYIHIYSKSFSSFFFFRPSTNVPQLFPGRCPRVCHRLDFRVSGPVLVATAEETMRDLD